MTFLKFLNKNIRFFGPVTLQKVDEKFLEIKHKVLTMCIYFGKNVSSKSSADQMVKMPTTQKSNSALRFYVIIKFFVM